MQRVIHVLIFVLIYRVVLSKRSDCFKQNYFNCYDKSDCISPSKLCNGYSDCLDSSDESKELCLTHKSSVYSKCPSNSFKCLDNILCISLTKICDKIMDCQDGSDEHFCGNEKIQFCEKLCGDSTKCINRTEICNGIIDCPYGDDELWCNSSNSCLSSDYRCGNSTQCVSLHSICNGYFDCKNNADEINCTINSVNKNEDFSNNYFQHDKSICDLPDKCLPCNKSCRCPSGYQSIENDTICIDINECERALHNCSQICSNNNGGYECLCYENYEKSLIKSTDCILKSTRTPENILLFTTALNLNYFNINNNLRAIVNLPKDVLHNSHYFYGLDYAYKNDVLQIFWSDLQQRRIYYAETTNVYGEISKIQTVYHHRNLMATQLCYDYLHNNLYYYNEADRSLNVIWHAVSHQHHQKRHSHRSHSDQMITHLFYDVDVASLTLDHTHRQLYWIDGHVNRANIVRVALNGDALEIIARNRLSPTGLILDPDNQRLFWLEENTLLVWKSMNAKDDRIHVIGQLNAVESVTSGAIVNQDLYFILQGLQHWGRLLKVNLFSKEIHWFMVDKILSIKHLIKPSIPTLLRTATEDLCGINNCSHICLPDYQNQRYSCHCNFSYSLNNDFVTCSKSKFHNYYRPINQQRKPHLSNTQLLQQSNYHLYKIATIVSIGVIVCVVLGFVMYYCVAVVGVFHWINCFTQNGDIHTSHRLSTHSTDSAMRRQQENTYSFTNECETKIDEEPIDEIYDNDNDLDTKPVNIGGKIVSI